MVSTGVWLGWHRVLVVGNGLCASIVGKEGVNWFDGVLGRSLSSRAFGI